jgi:L-threonylcarbamoyladenylate synthase
MSITIAMRALSKNQLVAIPTETVYGLAAPVSNLNLIKRIFELKERPLFDPLIVHVSSVNMAKKYTKEWNVTCDKLAEYFWPGPLTIIINKNDSIDKLLTAGLDTVGLRLPDHTLAREFIEELGEGVAAPSANTFTKTSPTTSDHVKKYFSSDDVYVLEGGDCQVGIESTIVSVDGNHVKLLRPGMITKEDIENVLPECEISHGSEHLKSIPGAHHTHYKPDYKLIVTMRSLTEKYIQELDKECNGSSDCIVMNESPLIIARSIYSILHTPLAAGCSYKIIDFSNNHTSHSNEQWLAVLNRLKKAAYKIIE